MHWNSRGRGRRWLSITPTVPPAANPLPDAKLQYVGYTQITRLETDAPLGIWNLLQLPAPGTILVATRRAVQPAIVFGEVAGDALVSEPALLRWRMAGS